MNGLFAQAFACSRAPKLEKVAMLAPLDEHSLAASDLRLAEISAVAGSWSRSGTPLYVYERSHGEQVEPPAAVTADRPMLATMMGRRREAEVAARRAGERSEGEMERGLLRTAMISAAMAQAMEKGSAEGSSVQS